MTSYEVTPSDATYVLSVTLMEFWSMYTTGTTLQCGLSADPGNGMDAYGTLTRKTDRQTETVSWCWRERERGGGERESE